MDMGLLKVFQAVAEEGSISKAAQSLNYVQSNVTARIQQLEQELKTPLFYRHSRGITLTSAGQTFMEYTVRILKLLDEAKQAVLDSPVPKGSITVGSDTTAAVRLPAILSAYRVCYPDVEVHLQVGRAGSLLILSCSIPCTEPFSTDRLSIRRLSRSCSSMSGSDLSFRIRWIIRASALYMTRHC